jgi:hypothetical protein
MDAKLARLARESDARHERQGRRKIGRSKRAGPGGYSPGPLAAPRMRPGRPSEAP